MKNISRYASDEMIILDRPPRSIESLRARKQVADESQEQALFAALCEVASHPTRRAPGRAPLLRCRTRARPAGGHVGAAPSFRTTPKGVHIGRFPLAVHDTESTHWHTVLTFNERTAKLQAAQLVKGQAVEVTGYVHERQQPRRDGTQKAVEEIYAVVIKAR